MSTYRAVLVSAFGCVASVVSLAQSTSRVSEAPGATDPNKTCGGGVISRDGSTAAFSSQASNLVTGDTNGKTDVFVRPLPSGAVERASLSSTGTEADGNCGTPAISGDGRCVAFVSSASNLVSGDSANSSDVFLRDRLNGTTECVSVELGGIPGVWGNAYLPHVSDDGRFVVFSSSEPYLVTGDSGTYDDVFVRDRVTNTTARVSAGLLGQEANGASGENAISADGRYVAFVSAASNLVSGDVDGNADAFLFDRTTGATTLLSTNSAGADGNDARYVWLSGDGQIALYQPLFQASLFLRDSTSATATWLVTGGWKASLSYDGRYVAFQYWSSSGPYFYGALIRDRQTGTDRAASLSSCGVSAWIPTGLYLGGSISTSVSGDGQRMLFNSPAMNLAAGDLNGKEDVFLRDFLAPASGPACSYCRPGTSSIGCVPSMSTSGIPSASSGAGFTLSCTNVQGQTYGILFMGLAPQLAPGGGPGSHFCVAVSARLTPPTNTSGTFNTCDGFLSIDWNAAVGSTLPPGEEVFAQAWLRDPGATSTVLSDAVQFYVRP